MASKKSLLSNAPDEFVIPDGEPFANCQQALTDFLTEVRDNKDSAKKPTKLESAKRLLAESKDTQVQILLAALNRMMWLCLRRHSIPESAETNEDLKAIQAHELLQKALSDLIGTVSGRKLLLTEDHLRQVLDVVVTGSRKDGKNGALFNLFQTPIPGVLPLLVNELESRYRENGLPANLRPAVEQLESILKELEFWAGYKKTLARLQPLLKVEKGSSADTCLPDTGEAWADGLLEDVLAMKPAARDAWLKLLANIPGATLAKPTAKWKAAASDLLKAVGHDAFARSIERWFSLLGSKAQQKLSARNGLILRALVWYASLLKGEVVCRALANAVEGGCRKLPQGGLFASSIAKACVAAMEDMPGLEPVAQLSRLRHRVKSPWGLEEIQKSLTNAVARSGVSLAEMEEVSCPTFDLDSHSTLRREIGGCVAELSIAGTHEVTLVWRDTKGNDSEREPAALNPHAAEVKAVKQLARDIEKMLLAHRERIERLVLSVRTWALSTWQARYLDHPLLANQSRRLIWQFTEGKRTEAGIWLDGKIVNAQGRALNFLKPQTQVRLWHPLGVPADAVRDWRQWLDAHQVSQPFKQAHREIYLLTDAELITRTYSNRFAAHILRQHQFKALCDARGWKYEFLGSWDSGDHTGATLVLPGFQLAAHFWLNHAGDQYTPAGVSVYASTDQVRFSNAETEALPLSDVPALAFSEIMRDVDLFVSVCSIGTDPTWNTAESETAADTRHQTYWEDFAFGELSATAQTRHDVIERLLPKLKIAAQCSLEKKFLIVKGSRRTYKIHLGSGNILMEPNDQYLCIVPDRDGAAAKAGDKVFLPFEGDSTLSVILSKAFLLADDAKIRDETILRQITTK